MILETFPLSATGKDTPALMDALEEAIAGQRCLLPTPREDTGRGRILSSHMRAGQDIEDTIALVVGTSGSTGTPKGAQLSPTNLVASADATHQRLGGVGSWLLALPAHHIAGIQVAVRSLLAGIDPVAMDLSHGFHPSHFAHLAAQLRSDSERCYTALTPMQLLKTMDTLTGIEALRLFDAILVGGGPLRAADRHAAKELGIHIVHTYGSAETAGGCVYDGVPLPGVRVRVHGERIYLGGPTIATGYRNKPHHEAFHEPGWYATSDTGHINDDGTLTVTGRLDTIIDSGGLKLHPEVLEHTLTDHPRITDACVVGIPDRRLGQAIVAAIVGDVTVGDLLEYLDEVGIPRWQRPKDFMKLEQLPLTSLGKVDRVAVQELFG